MAHSNHPQLNTYHWTSIILQVTSKIFYIALKFHSNDRYGSVFSFDQNSGCTVLEFINNSNQLQLSWKFYSKWRIVIPSLCECFFKFWACLVTQINWKQIAVSEKTQSSFQIQKQGGEWCKIFQYLHWRSVQNTIKATELYTHVCFTFVLSMNFLWWNNIYNRYLHRHISVRSTSHIKGSRKRMICKISTQV